MYTEFEIAKYTVQDKTAFRKFCLICREPVKSPYCSITCRLFNRISIASSLIEVYK